MNELRQGLIDSLLDRPMNGRAAMLEVVLMEGVNNSIKEADELAAFTQVLVDNVPGCKVVINLIPFNDVGHGEYQRPKQEAVVAFHKHLKSYGLYAHIRETRGHGKTAAYGQLATKKSKQ